MYRTNPVLFCLPDWPMQIRLNTLNTDENTPLVTVGTCISLDYGIKVVLLKQARLQIAIKLYLSNKAW